MSIGSVYILQTSNGYQDEYLNCLDLIKKLYVRKLLESNSPMKIDAVKEYLQDDGKGITFKDKIIDYSFLIKNQLNLPRISSIDKKFNVFLKYSYKPNAPVATQFSKKIHAEPQFGSSAVITVDKIGQFIADCYVHVVLTGLSAENQQDRVKYFDFPGARLFTKVRFRDNFVPISEYYGDYYMDFYKYHLTEDKKPAFAEMMGQQKKYKTCVAQDPAYDLWQEEKTFVNGPQTFQQNQEDLDLWIPLLFFFQDYKTALPISDVEWGNTDFVFDIAPAEELYAFANFSGTGKFNPPRIKTFELYVNYLYTDPLLYTTMMAKTKLIMFRSYKTARYTLTNAKDKVRIFNEIKWPSQLLELNFKPMANNNISTEWHNTAVLKKNAVQFPVAAKLASTVLSGTVQSMSGANVSLIGAGLSSVNDFYKDYYFNVTGGGGFKNDVKLNRYLVLAYEGLTNTVTLDRPIAGGNINTQWEMFIPQFQLGTADFYAEYSPVDFVKLTLDGVKYFDYTPAAYFEYPKTYSNNGIVTYQSPGHLSIPFGLEQNTRDASGHINIDAMGEIFLDYQSNYISPETPVELTITSTALNFFDIDSGRHIKLFFP